MASPSIAPVQPVPEREDETLREQIDRIRNRVRQYGSTPIDWEPIEIQGEPLSMTILRERRGDFDDEI